MFVAVHHDVVWEADSLEQVRSFVEEGVGDVSSNEFLPVEHQDGVHLPSTFAGGA